MKIQQPNEDFDIERTETMLAGGRSVHEPIERLLLRASEAAIMLGISRAKTYELLASGELPSIKIGRSVRISKTALYKWIADQEGLADDTATSTTTISPFRRR